MGEFFYLGEVVLVYKNLLITNNDNRVLWGLLNNFNCFYLSGEVNQKIIELELILAKSKL